MKRETIADLMAFVAVAENESFTRAAAELGMSQPALSQIVRRLEADLGVRLLARTTRSVAPTDAGDRLLATVGPLLRGLTEGVNALADFREKPAGTVRITSVEHAARTFILPRLEQLLRDYPDIRVEIIIDYGLVDVVADRFDAGVRLGEQLEKDMIAVRLSPEIPMVIAGAPDYFAQYSRPETPEDLIHHRCLNLRLPTSGTLNEWRFDHHSETKRVRVGGPLIFNTIELIKDAALRGIGLAYLPLDLLQPELADGRMEAVLADDVLPLPAYYLYYPNRRHASAAFRLLVEALRYRGK